MDLTDQWIDQIIERFIANYNEIILPALTDLFNFNIKKLKVMLDLNVVLLCLLHRLWSPAALVSRISCETGNFSTKHSLDI